MNKNSVQTIQNEKEILQAVHSIKYGSVLVIIQNSEIVQIETTNKKRFVQVIADNRQL